MYLQSEPYFFYISEFPNCVGVIDGTHIPIKAPWINGEQYKNYHKFYSIATQIVVNHRGAIVHLLCQWPGSVTDSRVLNESFLQDLLDRNILGRYYLLGDSGYACQYNLITPYSGHLQRDLTEEEKWFNKCLSRTRVKVECVIGQLKNKFSCLQNTSHYQPEVVCNVIKACCFLWNFGLLTGDNKGYDPDQFVVADHEVLNTSLEYDTSGGFTSREILKDYLWGHKHSK